MCSQVARTVSNCFFIGTETTEKYPSFVDSLRLPFHRSCSDLEGCGWSPIAPATPVAVGDECSSTISVQCESVWPDHAYTSPAALASCTTANIILSSWQYWHFGVWGVLPRRIWVTACAMSPIFQVDNVCVLRHQQILLCHRHVFKQSVMERSVLRRQKPGTVFRQKWCHQWHCRHLNKNFKNTFFTVISRHVISPHIDVQWLQCFCICYLKLWLIDWL